MPTTGMVRYRISDAVAALLLLALSYAVGGIPFAYIVVKATKGIDLRTIGSGNVGATNASRIYEGKWRFAAFAFIFLLDASKGYAAATIFPDWLRVSAFGPAIGGVGAVLGHIFSPYLGFSGGKAVATTFGALVGLEPVATLLAIGVFFAVYLTTRIVAAGSLAFAATLPALVAIRGRAPIEVLLLSIALAAVIIVRHRSNIARMLGGAQKT